MPRSIAPIGVLIGRYGRGVFPKWMKYHELVQGILTPVLTSLGFISVVIAKVLYGKKSFDSPHSVSLPQHLSSPGGVFGADLDALTIRSWL